MGMFLASLILIISTALFFFYLQIACQRILRRKFDREYSLSIVSANRLEFPAIRKGLEEFDAPLDYPRARVMLKCDYLALTYLLKNAANVTQRYTREERLLIVYFRASLLSLAARHLLRLKEKPAALKLTAVLEYFANVVGQRVDLVRFANLSASEYLLKV
ncbi:MAG: hypothetical protein ABSA70_00260 [Terriglobia bacterium]|jgi:hypothetical protein